jgi:hypothetical protein
MDRKLVSMADIYASKAIWRRQQAARSWEEKIKILIKLQHMAYGIKKQTVRNCMKPWGMQDETQEQKPSG